MWQRIGRQPRSGRYGFAAAILAVLLVVPLASCAIEPGQKPPVELRLDSPPSPSEIPLSDEEKATIQKHPHLGEIVRAWRNREFSVEFNGESIVFPAESAYAHIERDRVVSIDLFSPNLNGDELHHLMTTALRLWKASPDEVRRFEVWWRDNRESILTVNIGEGKRVVSIGVCPSFSREEPHVFRCMPHWGFPGDGTESPADVNR